MAGVNRDFDAEALRREIRGVYTMAMVPNEVEQPIFLSPAVRRAHRRAAPAFYFTAAHGHPHTSPSWAKQSHATGRVEGLAQQRDSGGRTPGHRPSLVVPPHGPRRPWPA